MNPLAELAGELCRILLPIEDAVYFGNQDSAVAVCTLSSMKLLEGIKGSSLMSYVNIAGRLLSENKGIDALVRHTLATTKIRVIILCGKDVTGHRAGESLLCLHRSGIDKNGRIIGSTSPDPVLTLTSEETSRFQSQARIIDMIGETDLLALEKRILNSV